MGKIFTAEFKAEAAQTMNVSLSAINRWVKSLRMERQEKTPPGLPLTPEQAVLRKISKRTQPLEM